MSPEARNFERWIARWEGEGGAVPQVRGARKRSAAEQTKAMTLRTILVPIDFSPESLKTLRRAEQLGKRFGAKLHLVHVIRPAFVSRARQAEGRSMVSKEVTAHTTKRLAELAAEFSLPAHPKPYTVRTGKAAEEINEVARAKNAGLIVIATRGFTGLKQAFLGSTTERLVRTTSCPVLVVRETRASARERASSGRTPPRFRKVLVPVDFSQNSRLGVEYGIRFVREFGARLVLFHSIPVTPFMLGGEQTIFRSDLIPMEQDNARRQMEKLRKEVSGKAVEIETEITFGSPVEEINDYVTKEGVDLIITATHGGSKKLERFFIGSTAEQIVRYAQSSVLVVPSRPSEKKPKNG